MDWLSSGGYRTKAITLVYLRGSLGYQDEHFSFLLPLHRLDGDLYFPKSLVGQEEGPRVSLSRGVAVEKSRQNL